MDIQKYLWLVPFVLFLVGYYGASYLFSVSAFQLPSLVGLPLTDAMVTLSQRQLYPSIIREEEDPDQDSGTVIQHIPAENASVKPHQTIFLTITKKPLCRYTPDLVGLSYEQAAAAVQQERLRMKWFTLPSVYPDNQVIAQVPSAGTPFKQSHIILYGSRPSDPLCIMPDCIGMTLTDFYEIIDRYGLSCDCYTVRGQRCRTSHSIIKQQRPLPGSFLNMREPRTIQVIAEE